tara:strand:- start:5832 stop:6731 length:900 start_codon:yes stop_codon:yes gene_type:complete
MNSQLSIWIQASRLRTLPLSLSGVIVGNGLALSGSNFSWMIFILSLMTTITFQVLSNLSNDYGDGDKGVDNESRIGPARVIQQGLLTKKELKDGIKICVFVSLFFAFSLIIIAFGTSNLLFSLIFILLAITAIFAAIKYTIGSNPYGYRALGDLFVLIFFGPVSVLGSYFLQSKLFNVEMILPAASIGLLSVGVLNLNNMRDIISDKASNKITFAVLLGPNFAKAYHVFLIIGAVLSALFYVKIDQQPSYLFMIAVLPMMIHLRRVLDYTNPKDFDPELKRLALCTFLFAILFSIGQNI